MLQFLNSIVNERIFIMFIIGLVKKLLNPGSIFALAATVLGAFGIFFGFTSLAYVALGISAVGLVLGIFGKKLVKSLLGVTGFVVSVIGLVCAATGVVLTILNNVLWDGLAETLFNSFL
jgi:hypothetical protein